MTSLVLRLEGPLQSWGVDGRYETRTTGRVPTKSGVVGLLASALGVERGDDAAVAELAGLAMTVRVDRAGELLEDFVTLAYGKDPLSLPVYGPDSNMLVTKWYLSDASFLVVLEGSDDLVARCAAALRLPAHALFLGRRACPPSPEPAGYAMQTPVLVGVDQRSADQIVTDLSSLPPRSDLHRRGLRIVRDARPGDAATSTTPDFPVSTSPARRTFRGRDTSTGLVTEPSHDPMLFLED